MARWFFRIFIVSLAISSFINTLEMGLVLHPDSLTNYPMAITMASGIIFCGYILDTVVTVVTKK